MQPLHIHNEIDCRLRFLLRLRREAVHRVESDNDLRVLLDDIGKVLAQTVDLQVFSHHLLQARGGTFQCKIHTLGAALDHEVNRLFVQQIAAQSALEIEVHIHPRCDHLAEERLKRIDIDIECIVDKLTLANAHIM